MVGKGGNKVNTSFFIVLLSLLKGEKNVITSQNVEVVDAYETPNRIASFTHTDTDTKK